MLALIVARELIQLPMSLVYRAIPTLRSWLRYDFRASVLGKAATITQFFAVGALVVGLPGDPPHLSGVRAGDRGAGRLREARDRHRPRAQRAGAMSEMPKARRGLHRFCPRRGASAITCCSARWRC